MFKTFLVCLVLVQKIYLLIESLTLFCNTAVIDVLQVFEPIKTKSFLDCIKTNSLSSLTGEQRVQINQLLSIIFFVGIFETD